MAPKRSTTRKRKPGTTTAEQSDRAALVAMRRHGRLLREISRETKRLERMRAKAKNDLLDFGLMLTNQAGWHVTKSEPAVDADRTV